MLRLHFRAKGWREKVSLGGGIHAGPTSRKAGPTQAKRRKVAYYQSWPSPVEEHRELR